MALLADGWHMATHVAALGITAFAYAYARRRASDRQYSFGTGKVSALGFASATGLAVVALLVFAASVGRLASPVNIRFNEAIGVAVIGLGAYLHVLADALTSLLAIAALVAAKLLGWAWMDAMTGIPGSIVIARWSLGLLRDTSAVLLDAEVPEQRRREIQAAVEADRDNRVSDLHIWRVGRRHLAAIVSVVTHEPREPSH
jgi:Co/Zn/Cd efflux system component